MLAHVTLNAHTLARTLLLLFDEQYIHTHRMWFELWSFAFTVSNFRWNHLNKSGGLADGKFWRWSISFACIT